MFRKYDFKYMISNVYLSHTSNIYFTYEKNYIYKMRRPKKKKTENFLKREMIKTIDI